MSQYTILWIDDEIQQIQSQIQFLHNKGYVVVQMNNGADGIEYLQKNMVDAILLDEMMPGLTGLETLLRIRKMGITVPVIMITKSEEENIMEEAIGNEITDYLLKPIAPQQVLSSLKKVLENKRLVSEKTDQMYRAEFNQLSAEILDISDLEGWKTVQKKLIFWELELENKGSHEMMEILNTQKESGNTEFFKFVSKNYQQWISKPEQAPVMSHNLMTRKILPHISEDTCTFFLLFDNLRYDQWKTLRPFFESLFTVVTEELYCSILPTATQYCRNAIFAGMLPLDISKRFPNYWKNDDDEGGKNLHEQDFLADLLQRYRKNNIKYSYTKLLSHLDHVDLLNNVNNLFHNNLNVVVINFIDMLSHTRTEMEVLKELANNPQSYRSISRSWFEHSPLLQSLKKIAQIKKVKIIVSTDHGTIQVQKPSKVIGDKQTTTNLRYKHGRNLTCEEPKDVLMFKNPNDYGLPSPTINSSYIFARENVFLCYPNNYNHFANYYAGSFQHGGVSLEEMLIPIVTLISK
ncbi:MAG: PglZ domain-containing protein [Phycisphaerales bacterium]|nr:PglZ domain-containing protein [Phycisphaerales bacterium]